MLAFIVHYRIFFQSSEVKTIVSTENEWNFVKSEGGCGGVIKGIVTVCLMMTRARNGFACAEFRWGESQTYELQFSKSFQKFCQWTSPWQVPCLSVLNRKTCLQDGLISNAGAMAQIEERFIRGWKDAHSCVNGFASCGRWLRVGLKSRYAKMSPYVEFSVKFVIECCLLHLMGGGMFLGIIWELLLDFFFFKFVFYFLNWALWLWIKFERKVRGMDIN